jgi:hypothetical protein
MSAFSSLQDLTFAQMGMSLPLAYGPVGFSGNKLRETKLVDNSTIMLIGAGEGEWDGLERGWVNRKLIDVTDVNVCHFHPGTETPLGSGLAPSSNGGDQLVDNFFGYFPSNQQRLSFSGLAYVALWVRADPQAPSATPDWYFHARGIKVRSFDASGTQLAYAYSKNYAWIILDLYLRSRIKIDALKGDALTTAEKACIDFAALADAAAYCDAALAGGQKRFEGGFFFTERQTLKQAVDKVRTAGQIYVLDVGGVLTIRPDKPRASVFVLKSSMITSSSLKFPETSLRGASNRFNASFRDAKARKIVTIATAVRAAGVVTVTTNEVHPFLSGDDTELVDTDDASFNVVVASITVTSTTTFTFAQAGANATAHGGYVGTPESRFVQRSIVLDHDAHQKAIAQRGLGLAPAFKRNQADIDLGVCTAEQAQRIIQFLSARTLGPDAQPYKAPQECEVDAEYYAYDSVNDRLLCECTDGDVITIDASISEEFAGDYEMMESVRSPLMPAGEGGQFGKMSLKLLAYSAAAYSDVAPVDPDTVAGAPPRQLTGAFILGSDGLTPILNSPKGSVPLTFKGAIAFTKTTTTIQWTPNITAYRTDSGMEQDTITASQTVTGLTASTSYNHYPFIDDLNGAVFDMVRTGGTGSPTWAHIGVNYAWTQEQARADHAALSVAPLAVTTTSSGSGSGSGGGDGTCSRVGTPVEHETLGVVAIEQCRAGERILGPRGWRRIKSIERYPNETWIRVRTVKGTCEDVTPGHRFKTIEGLVCKAAGLNLESIIAGRGGAEFLESLGVVRELDYAVKVTLEADAAVGDDAHLYYAGNGPDGPSLINHNIVPC